MTNERRDGRRLLTITLAIGFLLSLVGVGYLALTPQATTDPYTELYLLGSDGNASGYPTNLSVGETGRLVVGVVNHEHRELTYTVVLELDTGSVDERTFTVEDEERWERPFTFTPSAEGRQRLSVRLYRGQTTGQSAEPYRELWLWITVSG